MDTGDLLNTILALKVIKQRNVKTSARSSLYGSFRLKRKSSNVISSYAANIINTDAICSIIIDRVTNYFEEIVNNLYNEQNCGFLAPRHNIHSAKLNDIGQKSQSCDTVVLVCILSIPPSYFHGNSQEWITISRWYAHTIIVKFNTRKCCSKNWNEYTYFQYKVQINPLCVYLRHFAGVCI